MNKFMSTYDSAIAKWGNSQAVRLTADILRQAEFDVSEPVRIIAEQGRITIEPLRKKVDLNDLLNQITDGTGLELISFGKPVGRERL